MCIRDSPRTSASTIVWDTVPNAVAGASDGSVIYTGEQGPYPGSQAGGVVKFTLGSITDEGGTFTWWGKVNSCNPITNESWIGGTGEVPQKSNQVVANPVCQPITGITKTASGANPAGLEDVITWTLTCLLY